jgi:putative alpha-1,2-mannosidase
LYKLGPAGLSGNDDCGQMSAWLVWTMMGCIPEPSEQRICFWLSIIKRSKLNYPTITALIKVNKQKNQAKQHAFFKITHS